MNKKSVLFALILALSLALLLANAGCHKSETKTAAPGGPHEPPMLTRVRQSQGRRQP